MLALVNTPGGNTPVELRDVAEPETAANEAIVEVRAFSLNRGGLSLLANRPEGWRPGQDIAGVCDIYAVASLTISLGSGFQKDKHQTQLR
jgi:NADPH:quinone reductase-like Zn-dependent oxidoreductase